MFKIMTLVLFKWCMATVLMFGTVSAEETMVKTAPFINFPIHFLGLLPGANCNSQYQLDLFEDQSYFLRNRCFKNEKSTDSDDIGRWEYDIGKKQLTLIGGSDAAIFFLLLDPETIEKLDHTGERIDSILNYKLERSYTALILEPKVLMWGMYQYMADAAMFQECRTGRKLPVLFEKDNLALERAYTQDEIEAGGLLKVQIEGQIVQRSSMEVGMIQAHLLVERFIKTIPNESCD